MKSLDTRKALELLSAMLEDLSMACRTSMVRDLMTIRSRTEHEGQSFLTLTLPTYAKAFELALEQGRIDPSMFAGFKSASKLPFPAFLQGLVGQVFDSEGVIKDAPNADAVEGIRQLCLSFNKIKLECTSVRLRAAEKQFEATEGEVSRFRVTRYEQHKVFTSVANILYRDVLGSVGDKLMDLEIVPRHGPGSTVDRTYGNRKFTDRRWTERLQRTFPFDWYKLFNYNEEEPLGETQGPAGIGEATILQRKSEPPVRVVFVPKTMKTPRVIAIEPVWTQEVQQGLMREFVRHLESDRTVGGQINFTDQTINRNLAFESSNSRKYATIDLSEASDRVHPSLVAKMFSQYPHLNRAVFACRSERAQLPSGKVIPLKKFASQGSALCFPVEAMVFYSIAVSALLKRRDLSLTSANVKTVAKDVFVYGDDIIVPTQEVTDVIRELEAAGLKVNRKKSFYRGHFRESCGMDAFMGVNVTPVYVRHPLPCTSREAEEIAGTVSTANQFYRKGYWKTAAKLRQFVEAVAGVVPHVPDNSPVLGWHSYQQISSFQRWNPVLQRLEVRGLKLRARRVEDRLDGYRALHKWAISRNGKVPVIGGDEPLSTEAFMSRVVTGGTKIYRQWAPSL
jgi:hypothetical protein